MRAAMPRPEPAYTVGLDLGQSQDYTALAVLEHVPGATRDDVAFHARHLLRYALGTPYPAIVVDVAALLAKPPLHRAALAVDGTGVGAAVVDLFRQRVPRSRLSAITITGGNTVTRDGRNYLVPKRDLVGVVQVLLQSGRLKVAPALPEAAILTAELENFQVRITEAAHDTYGAWREGTHDDLVLAVALAAWAAQNVARNVARSFG